ncbi:MAG: cytochrome c3 family protein [Acidobacteria bacterium]|nr:cytochrome c3 family protein [Acidobacteriota bacterium]
MKKLLLGLMVLAGTSAMATIVGTKHDLSSAAPAGQVKTNTGQVCVFCHTPHNAAAVAAQLIPLWNHTTTATATWQMYTNANVPVANLQGTVDASPTGASLACFSCHDGTLAVGAIGNIPNDVASITYTAGGNVNGSGLITGGNTLLGTDLRNDHPIAITYQDNLDTGLNAPATLTTARLFPTNATGNKVQCASCHDVHNSTFAPFLRGTMVGSALCRQCHNK